PRRAASRPLNTSVAASVYTSCPSRSASVDSGSNFIGFPPGPARVVARRADSWAQAVGAARSTCEGVNSGGSAAHERQQVRRAIGRAALESDPDTEGVHLGLEVGVLLGLLERVAPGLQGDHDPAVDVPPRAGVVPEGPVSVR